MQLENQNIDIKNVISSCRLTPPPGSTSTRSPLADPAAPTPPALLAARFTVFVVIEIFKIDYPKKFSLNKYISIRDAIILSP